MSTDIGDGQTVELALMISDQRTEEGMTVANRNDVTVALDTGCRPN